jgi:hypothetical protein
MPGAGYHCCPLSRRDAKYHPPMAIHLRLQRAKRSAYRKFSGVSGWRAELAGSIPCVRHTEESEREIDHIREEACKEVVGGLSGTVSQRLPSESASRQPPEGNQSLANFLNKHNTLSPFIDQRLCSLIERETEKRVVLVVGVGNLLSRLPSHLRFSDC